LSLELAVLASGSSGNAIYLADDQTALLIDAGLSGKEIEKRMNLIERSMTDVDALLLTHEHGDHIKGAGVLSRRYNLPVFATEGTWLAGEKRLGRLKPEHKKIVRESWELGKLQITSFPIPHDAREPVGYIISNGRVKVGLATDIGYITAEISQCLQGMDCLLLEANHDIDLLREGSYPVSLKKRIRGEGGHLSNEETARLLPDILESSSCDCPVVLLSHLSAENNRPELAYLTVKNSLQAAGFRVGSDVILKCAPRNEPGELFSLTGRTEEAGLS